MSRLGSALLLFFVAVIGGFAWLVKRGGKDNPSSSHAEIMVLDGVAMPIANIQLETLHDTWGEPRSGGSRAHHALDIPAPRGTPVLVAASGRIEKVFESKDGGHTVYIRRDDPRWIDYYAHLDSYAPGLREGAEVRLGQEIGTVGSSGNASPDAPHLHFEIKRMAAGERWWQGTNIDPYPLVTACGGLMPVRDAANGKIGYTSTPKEHCTP